MKKKRHYLCVLISLFLFHTSILAENTVSLKGFAPQYAKMGLVLETRANPISRKNIEVVSFMVDAKGNFESHFEIDNILKVTIDLGKYEGYFYIEPGKSYDLILPDYTPKSDAERLNPFFQPEQIIIGIKNEDGILLNSMIRDFNEEFNHQFAKNIAYMFHRENTVVADSLIRELDKLFPSFDNSIFGEYKHYKYSLFYDASYKNRKSIVYKKFFYNQPFHISNPAFIEAFNQIYSNFITNYMRKKSGKELKRAYNLHDFDSLSVALKQDTLYSNTLFRELLLLKGLYDGYYGEKLSGNSVRDLLQDVDSASVLSITKEIANQLFSQINMLRVGTKAPDFELYQLNGKKRSLSDFKGKFIYLNFCNTKNYSCKKDMQVLSQISRDHRRKLNIVTILTDQDQEAALEFITSNKYKWPILHYENMQKIMIDYNIKALPTYFLINPDGILSLSPAPAPEEGFLFYFTDAYNDYKYKKLKSKPQKTKSIYDL